MPTNWRCILHTYIISLLICNMYSEGEKEGGHERGANPAPSGEACRAQRDVRHAPTAGVIGGAVSSTCIAGSSFTGSSFAVLFQPGNSDSTSTTRISSTSTNTSGLSIIAKCSWRVHTHKRHIRPNVIGSAIGSIIRWQRFEPRANRSQTAQAASHPQGNHGLIDSPKLDSERISIQTLSLLLIC